ncbi:hypothetical protein [Vibrio vulnificus]|uniref:hypothetical protein n=1 Tax=Vibrio vulnificus TaxID=672 RepID=UPI001E51C2C3|nr:hypothetical protein [Vibrio vulnificus]
MKNHEQGAATLLVTSVLLIAALMATLGSYKTLFYQIKRAQNEVLSRQSYWKAEGAWSARLHSLDSKGIFQLRLLFFPLCAKFH